MSDYSLSAIADSAMSTALAGLPSALGPDGRHAKPPQICAASREGLTGALWWPASLAIALSGNSAPGSRALGKLT